MNQIKIRFHFSHFSFGYSQQVLFENIHVSFEPENSLLINGVNGSGKSSLLKIFLGLEKKYQGLCFLETPKTKQTITQSDISYVDQQHNIDYQIPFSVKEVLHSGVPYNQKLDSSHFFSIINNFNIDHLLDKNFHQLSGGEKQKILIARALVKKPQVLILDESFSNIDTHAKMSLFYLVQEFLNRIQCFLILVTHDIQLLSIQKGGFLVLGKNKWSYFENFDQFDQFYFHLNSNLKKSRIK